MMATLLWLLAVVIVISGIFAIIRGQLLWGLTLIVVGIVVGPGGFAAFSNVSATALFVGLAAVVGIVVVVAGIAGLYRRRGELRERRTSAGPTPARPRRTLGSVPTQPSWSPPSTGTPYPQVNPDARATARQSVNIAPPPRTLSAEGLVRPTPAPTRIFVNYRRSDTRYAARGVADHLRDHFGRSEVFMDVDSLEVGADFVNGVRDAIQMSAVVLVLIGDHWLAARDQQGRSRLHDPNDNVRMEIEHAFRWKKNLLPVLLDTAAMPRADDLPSSLAPLPRLNGVRLDHVRWDADMVVLVNAIERWRPGSTGRG